MKLDISQSIGKRGLKLKTSFFASQLLLLLLFLSGCGLISSKPTQTQDSPLVQPQEVAETQLRANDDVIAISQTAVLGTSSVANTSLRLLALIQESKDSADQAEKIEAQHGYFWLDGIVKEIHEKNGSVAIAEVESIYDGERYVVNGSAKILDKLSVGRFAYLNGFYDTFSGFTALEYKSTRDLLDSLADAPLTSVSSSGASFQFGTIEQFNKRKQSIDLSNKQEILLSEDVSFYDAYSKEAIAKNAFWRALSQGDVIYAFDDQIWLVDEQSATKAVLGTIKRVNERQNEIVLATEMWLIKDGEAISQNAEVLLKLDRKSQVISSTIASLVPGQNIVVEGTTKNRSLNVASIYLKDKKKLPAFVYGTVQSHSEADMLVDLNSQWMFGVEPASSVEVSINGFTELFDVKNREVAMDSTDFWKVVSHSDEIEVEGYMVGDTLQANRLYIANKAKELQTLSGTIESLDNNQAGNISLRLYSYSNSSELPVKPQLPMPFPKLPTKDTIDLMLAKDVAIQDIHGAESIVVEEFLRRLEPTDRLTVTGYFEDSTFVATTVEFEDKDTTPFMFGEIEAFDASKKQLMLKGKNQVVVLTRTTSIKDSKLERLPLMDFWSELRTGDSIDIKGLYKDGIFFASEVFLSSKTQEVPVKKDNFNLFEWLMN